MQTGSRSICMSDKDLNALAYIDYRPLYNPFMGSQVFMLDFTDDLKPHLKDETLIAILVKFYSMYNRF